MPKTSARKVNKYLMSQMLNFNLFSSLSKSYLKDEKRCEDNIKRGTLLKCANLGSRREPCANLGSRRELKIFSQVCTANHFQKSVSGANQKYFHRFAPRTIFKNLLVAQTKNILTGSHRESFSKIYFWCEPKIFSIFHRFALQT